MSENTLTSVYLLVAGVNVVISCWKGVALLRERTATLALITLSFIVSVPAFIAASPAGYRAIGKAMGHPSGATLIVYSTIIICYAITHVLTLMWNTAASSDSERNRVSRRAVSWTGLYAGVLVAMAMTFWSADIDGRAADPMHFNTTFADDPFILAYLVIFLAALSSALLNTFRLARSTKPEDPTLQHAIRYFSISMLVCCGYVACNVPAVLMASQGNRALEDLCVLAGLFGSAAAGLTDYGMTGAAVSAWLRERRDIKALQPLWELTVADVDNRLALDASGPGWRLANVRFTLHRRVVEILDGMRVLRAWSSADASEVMERQVDASTAPLSVAQRQAVVTAAVLRDASLRLQAARILAAGARPVPPDAPVAALPGEDTAASAERSRLLLVATHLHHPLVESVLQELRARGTEAQGAAEGRAVVS
ncbi:MAB_1171c family putative transporter [Streptomyces sp. NPDC058548]|uniref:MAB_1171c family putative transporter n=1 Tax=Streptomyces sp. NPDC058548 TaxID=3346545 RepID=UPI00366A5050